ncbi:MAG: DNA (cytosine-5-)-methyltransferase [Christensenellaceae bacterium]
MSEYLTTKEAANIWGVTSTWVSILCAEKRILGAIKIHGNWMIPPSSKKPLDKRVVGSSKCRAVKFRFIDLFAGIGGFHQAMRCLGGECLMAAEINQACVETYKKNFSISEGEVRGDVKKIDPKSIGKFDVLCAGFPCQPFSKAGQQKGFEDETRGNLFYAIMDILDEHREVQFVVLENVRNLADKTENWSIIKAELLKRDFIITESPLILSPSDFGIPQIRERVYILGIKRECCNATVRDKGFIELSDLCIDRYRKKCKPGDAFSILESNADDSYLITEEQALMIEAWDEFRKGTKITVIGFPLWISCFGIGVTDDEVLRNSLSYSKMPTWKKNFVNKNRKFYLEHKDFIDSWIQKYDMTSRIKLYQKFEWNCGTDIADIKDGIIQIRQSGIRVKRATFFPSLVAIVNTPIIWDRNKQAYRYITPREAANLQNFDQRYKFVGTDQQIYRQLGNSVNVRILKILCKNLFEIRKKSFNSSVSAEIIAESKEGVL